MGLLGPTSHPRRREQARQAVAEHLRRESGGLPGVALVDRLTRWGFQEREAMTVLREMEERGELRLSGGRWFLRDDA